MRTVLEKAGSVIRDVSLGGKAQEEAQVPSHLREQQPWFLPPPFFFLT